MKITISISLSAITAILCTASFAAENAEAKADKILREMSAKLAAAKQFTFKAQREIDPALIEGRNLAEKANIALAVSRPNQIAARSVSKARTIHMIANGKTLTILDEDTKHYAQVAMRTSIDGLVERLDKEYGFIPPLADFAVRSPYQEIRMQARTATYMGREKLPGGFLGLGSMECEHLSLKGKEADADLWIAASDQLPRKLVATFHRQGNPELKIAFSDWNLSASVRPSSFAFVAPEGSQKIDLWTTARMQSAGKERKTK